ncbi:MAG: helicase-associated domain-containing protein [Chloroflexi bacterium]|nr:helicase-associated domain-containing protein [Chloroflexota bacterium]
MSTPTNAARAPVRALPAERLLAGSHRDVLRAIAKAHSIGAPLPRKPKLVKLLAARLADPQIVRAALDGMPPITRQILEWVREQGGCAQSAEIMRALAAEGAPADAGLHHEIVDALWPLLQFGLLISRLGDWLPPTLDTLAILNTELLIPAEVLEAIRPARRPLRAPAAGQIERIEEGAAQTFQRDVYLYWNYLRGRPVELTAAGLVPKRHLTRLNEVLIGKVDLKRARDEVQAHRLHFIRLMMEETGLARRSGRRLEAIAGAHEFFGYSLTRRTDRFVQAWRRSARWNELLHLPVAPRMHEERSARAFQLVARARQAVVKQIAESAGPGWSLLSDCIERMRDTSYEFLFRRSREDYGAINPYYYYHNPLGWGFPVADEREGWTRVEQEYITAVVRDAMHWLGLVSLGHAGGALLAFRLTPLGAYLLGIGSAPPGDEAAGAGHIVVQPNFQIFALEPIAEQTLSMLDRFADRVKADKVYEYHLSRESIYRAQQKGMTSADVIAYLARTAASILPQNVQRTLEEWGQSYDRIVVRRGVSLIHALEPALLDALQAAPGVRLISRPLPRVALAPGAPERREPLLRALKAQGLLPAFTAGADDIEDALTLDADGRVTVLQAVPSVFLLKELEQHAERRPDGYYLSEAIVKSERNAGESIEEIIARWQRWHHGPLPGPVVIAIRRWGQFYGRARLREMRLMQLPSADVAQALLDDPETGPLLHPYPADPSSVFVADEHVDQVRALLEARGIPVG